jgi:hypothetical protein
MNTCKTICTIILVCTLFACKESRNLKDLGTVGTVKIDHFGIGTHSMFFPARDKLTFTGVIVVSDSRPNLTWSSHNPEFWQLDSIQIPLNQTENGVWAIHQDGTTSKTSISIDKVTANEWVELTDDLKNELLSYAWKTKE